jgi:hypothetical protein
MREETTSRVMAADRPFGEFYEFYSVSPKYFLIHPRIRHYDADLYIIRMYEVFHLPHALRPGCNSCTCWSTAHKTFRGKTRLEAGLCQLHNSLPLLMSVSTLVLQQCHVPTDRPTSHQTRHYFNIANAVTYHLSSAEAGRIQMCLC